MPPKLAWGHYVATFAWIRVDSAGLLWTGRGEIYVSGRLDDTFVHGISDKFPDMSKTFSLRVKVKAPSKEAVKLVSPPGNPWASQILTNKSLDVEVDRMFVRSPKPEGGFEIETIVGEESILEYLTGLGF